MMRNLLRETDHHGVNKIDSDTADGKQEKCDEISKEMRSCVDQDLLEEGFH